MNKHLLSCLTLLYCVVITSQAQSTKVYFTMEDAGHLNQLFKENAKGDSATSNQIRNAQEFFAFFKKYGKYSYIDSSILLQENPFLTQEDIIRLSPIKKLSADSTGIETMNFFQESNKHLDEVVVTALGIRTEPDITWQTAVLDGTARFLTQRFKEELSAYYLNTFYKKIENQPIIKTLFPRTTNFLKVFANQVYNTDVAMLQTAAMEDMNNFVINIIPTLEHLDALKENTNLKAGLALGLDIYKQIGDGVNVTEIINSLPNAVYIPAEYKNYLSLLRILSCSIQSYDVRNEEGPWGDLEELLDVEARTQRYYFALLYEQLKNVEISKKTIANHIGKKRKIGVSGLSNSNNYNRK